MKDGRLSIEDVNWCGMYHDGMNSTIYRGREKGDTDYINFAAERMGPIIPLNAILIPMPGHRGKAEHTCSNLKTNRSPKA